MKISNLRKKKFVQRLGDFFKKNPGKVRAGVIIFLFLVGSVFLGLILKIQVQSRAQNLAPMSKQDIQRLIQRVSEIMEIPKDEKPQVATIVDVNELKGKKFFAEAKNGDKVLLFLKAGKVVLYRPSTHKIINAGMLDLAEGRVENNKFMPDKEEDMQFEAKAAFLNGTNISGLASKMSKELSSRFSGLESKIVGNAKKRGYDKTVIIPLTSEVARFAQKIADDISASFSASLPTGEIKYDGVDLVIILGEDAQEFFKETDDNKSSE